MPSSRPRVAVVFTGGTIAMTVDPDRGGNVPTLDGSALLALVPGLDAVASVVPIDLGRVPASHFHFDALLAVADAVRRALDDPAIDGAVIVQGTDTIEETAFCWDLVLDRPEPVVVTGAMRSASEDGYDGPGNLRDAIRCAASAELRDQGVCVVLAGEIHPADDVAKTHATALATFRSPNLGPLGIVEGDRVRVARRRGARRHVTANAASERVHLVTAVVGMDGTVIDALVGAGAEGLVVAATGAGNTSAELLDAARRAMAAGIPVAHTTRCAAGRAGSAYAFPGGGSEWRRAGALATGWLSGPKARVALALGIGAGLPPDALARLLDDPS